MGFYTSFCLHAVKACRECEDVAPFILNLGTRLEKVANFTPRPLRHRNSKLVLIDYETL